jgi:hypothetical protein
MSGGSFNYLWCHVNGLEGQRGDIEEMARVLEEFDHDGVTGMLAARATRDVLRLLDGAERIARQLAEVWHDVEWWQSCDYGPDSVADELRKFTYPQD